MSRQRVVRVVKERSWTSQLLMLLVIALLIALVPQLIVVPAAYFLFVAARSLMRKRPRRGLSAIEVRPKWSPLKARVKAASLRKVGSVKDCDLFIHDDQPACLLALRSFTLTGSGCLYVKPVEPYYLDVKPLVNASLRMKRQLVLSLIVDPSRHGGLGVAALVSVRSSRRCLRVGEEEVREVVEDVERCLDGVRAVIFSQPQGAEVGVLKGDELLEASVTLTGACL
ncbi:MAG: hypothetical protein N3H31_03765 [Candidatus Nezhaarchaeota archaeon]|nr:hypothetical protein [Candidatus Nezhaarchaeota archaeon]